MKSVSHSSVVLRLVRLPWGNQLLIMPIQRGCLAGQMDWWMPRVSLSVWRVLYLYLPMNLVLQTGNDQPCCLADHTLSAAGSGHHAICDISLCIHIFPWSGIRGKQHAIQRSLTVCYPAIRGHFHYHFLSIATLTDFGLITLSVTSVVQTVKCIQICESGKFHFPSSILS